jgi:hypothetical protein
MTPRAISITTGVAILAMQAAFLIALLVILRPAWHTAQRQGAQDLTKPPAAATTYT